MRDALCEGKSMHMQKSSNLINSAECIGARGMEQAINRGQGHFAYHENDLDVRKPDPATQM